MIARLQILLPYTISVPVGQEFNPHEREVDGYVVRIFPPYRCQVDRAMLEPDSPFPFTQLGRLLARADPQPRTELVRVDGVDTTQANALQVDFIRVEFVRVSNGDPDPPLELAFGVVNDLIGGLRTLGRSATVKPVSPKTNVWRIEYLNDDESELDVVEGQYRAIGGASWQWKVFGLRTDLWEATRTLPADFEPTPWDTLLLDALDLLPEVGPAIVLAFAAVETRIESALDLLALAAGLSEEFWKWIKERDDDYRKEPSVREQLDQLLHGLSGRSLKSEQRLWEAFQNLREARNKFVHEGQATIGGQPVTFERANELLGNTGDIIEWIEQLLPESERRPSYERQTDASVELIRVLTVGAPQQPEQPETAET